MVKRGDRYRISGPEKTIIPLAPASAPLKLNPSKRPDARTRDEIRPIYAKTHVISQANGSALLEMGNLKVICGV